MQDRVWVDSGIVETIDQKQMDLLALVYEKIVFYYAQLYQTRPCFQYPLTLSRLAKLCNRSGSAVTLALRFLANTVPEGSDADPVIYYDRISSAKNKTHRPYRIFLRRKHD